MFDTLTLAQLPQADEDLRPVVRDLVARHVSALPLDQRARSWQGFDAGFSRALGQAGLLPLWAWDEAAFQRHTEGSAIRCIGHRRWQRNLAVALGNAWRATGDVAYPQALLAQREQVGPLVQEHVDWALAQGPAVGGEGAAGVDAP